MGLRSAGLATWVLSNSDGSVVLFPTSLPFFFLLKKLLFGDNFKLTNESQGESELKEPGARLPRPPCYRLASSALSRPALLCARA